MRSAICVFSMLVMIALPGRLPAQLDQSRQACTDSQKELELSDCRKPAVNQAHNAPGPPSMTASHAPGSSEQPGPEAGSIQRVNGIHCLLQRGEAKPKRITHKDKLLVGDKLQCFCGSSLQIELQGTTTTLYDFDKCFSVPQVEQAMRDEYEQAVPHYRRGELGGRRRGLPGMEVLVYSPATDSSVVPSQLVFRWVPDPEMPPLSLSIKDEQGEEIWSARNVDAKRGQLISEEARQRLLEYRGSSRTAPLALVAQAGEATGVNHFSLLSIEKEQILNQEMSNCIKQTREVMVHVCRAGVFEKFDAYSEVAAEYDQAHALAPESRSLLDATRAAHQRIGDSFTAERISAVPAR
jgi:hypothetical protein